MRKLNQKFYGASLVALAFSLSAADVKAQTCTPAPSCDTLGFTKSATDCTGHSVLKCPFDQSKLYCDSGATGQKTICHVGDILFSDKTCSVDLISGKTPIGVVFNESRGLAVGLTTAKLKWSDELFDVPGLKNYGDSTITTNVEDDYSGKSNTAVTIAYCKSNKKSCPAFEYVSNYKTPGTSTGDWYLPAIGELDEIWEHRYKIITILEKIGATKIPEDNHWSSSELCDADAYVRSMYTFPDYNGGGWTGKTASFYVRPALAF